MTHVWVVTGITESSDGVGPYVWAHEPSQKEIDAVLAEKWTDDFEAGLIYARAQRVEVFA